MTVNRTNILDKFQLFRGGTGGLDNWLSDTTPEVVFETLGEVGENPLTRSRLNQLLTRSHEAPMTDAFFRYYWLTVPKFHPYDVKKIPCFDPDFCDLNFESIVSLNQLYWGLYRFYVDALLFFGNVRTAFQRLRLWSNEQLEAFFARRSFKTKEMTERGEPLGPDLIEKGDRYLISEMACKSLDAGNFVDSELARTLLMLYRQRSEDTITVAQLLEDDDSLDLTINDQDDLLLKIDSVREAAVRLYQRHQESQVTAGQLLRGAVRRGGLGEQQQRLYLSADDFLDDPIKDENDLLGKIQRVHQAFENARKIALKNTKTYLSMVSDLDVYVATSMRERSDFFTMADFCDRVFSDASLSPFNLRYFDPTLSAAQHHEDKGLIECLMVKRAKALVLHAGTRDSYGKDAEAAMALSLGKPVIIHADEEYRSRFFKDVHPLSRLINFENGVAIGAMVATSPEEVTVLLKRIFENDLEFRLEHSHPNYLVLKEVITGSVVRLQTSDSLIRETFWNHYHSDLR